MELLLLCCIHIIRIFTRKIAAESSSQQIQVAHPVAKQQWWCSQEQHYHSYHKEHPKIKVTKAGTRSNNCTPKSKCKSSSGIWDPPMRAIDHHSWRMKIWQKAVHVTWVACTTMTTPMQVRYPTYGSRASHHHHLHLSSTFKCHGKCFYHLELYCNFHHLWCKKAKHCIEPLSRQQLQR